MVNGKMRWVSAKTKAECAAKLHKAAQEARAGQAQPDSQVTVAQYLVGWLEGMKARVRPRTWSSYETHVRLHIRPSLGAYRLAELSPAHVTAMLSRVVAGGARGTTAQRVRATLRSALADALRSGLLARNVASITQAPRAAPVTHQWLDTAQARLFLESAIDNPAGDLLALILLLGLRRGEALGLK